MRCKEASLSERESERERVGERGCKVHDGDGGRHYKSFIFGSRTADAEMQVNVYRECEKVMRTISDTDTFLKSLYLSLTHRPQLTGTHLLLLCH